MSRATRHYCGGYKALSPKQEKKVLDLWLKHGIEVPFLCERFGVSDSAIRRVIDENKKAVQAQ